jgi:hypothetical protein
MIVSWGLTIPNQPLAEIFGIPSVGAEAIRSWKMTAKHPDGSFRAFGAVSSTRSYLRRRSLRFLAPGYHPSRRWRASTALTPTL